MKIYIPHSTGFDYHHELYIPVRASRLNEAHHISLPHEQSAGPIDTRTLIQNVDLVIAEVSYPSTGMGIELGWADSARKPIVAIYRKGQIPSASLKMVTKSMQEYSLKDLESVLAEIIPAY